MRPTRPFHIMITDSNHHIRDLLKRELEHDGYTVCCVTNGAKVYQSIQDAAFLDLVILDPETLVQYGTPKLSTLLSIHPKVHFIIHSYQEIINEFIAEDNVHIVEKTGASISKLKEKINGCLKLS